MDAVRDLAGQPLFITMIVAGVGGVAGGFFAGRRANTLASAFIGAIVGTIVALVVRGAQVYAPVAIDGFSLVWAILGGAFGAYVIGRSPG